MKISQKQAQIAAAIKGRQAKQIFLFGALGTSKTFGAAVAMLSVAVKYPDSLIIVARLHLTELRRGTLLSFQEAAEEMNLTPHVKENKSTITWDIELEQADGTIKHSYVMFLELNHLTDRQFSKIKSINATCAMIDEADGVLHDAHIALFSRTGRRNRNGAPRFILDTCNPNDAWIKDVVYDHWHDPDEHGALDPDMLAIEFETKDSFLEDEYYDAFAGMPDQWKKRYLWNDWNFGDDEASLFKYRHMDGAHVPTIESATRYIGYDVARSGQDRSVLAMWEGTTLVDIKITKDKLEAVDTSVQADMLHDYATENHVGYQNVSVDAVGIGVGVVDAAKANHQMYVHEFVSGAASTEMITVKTKDNHGKVKLVKIPKYNNKRSEVAFLLAKDLEEGRAHFYDGCPFLAEFKKEATMHNYEVKDRISQLEPKEKVKARLGASPDLFDAVLMGYERVLRGTKRKGGIVPSVGGNYSALYKRRPGSDLMSV